MPCRGGSRAPPPSADPPPPSAAPSLSLASPPASSTPRPSDAAPPDAVPPATTPPDAAPPAATPPDAVPPAATPLDAAPRPKIRIKQSVPSTPEETLTKSAILQAPTSPRRDPPRRNPPRGASAKRAEAHADHQRVPPTPKKTLTESAIPQAPTSPRRDPPRHSPPRGESAKREEADDYQRVKSSPVIMQLDAALSLPVRPKIKFVTRHDAYTPQPASAITHQTTLALTVPTSLRSNPPRRSSTTTFAAVEKDDKRRHRIQSLTFKGIDGRGGSGSDSKDLAVIYDDEMILHEPPDYMDSEQVKEEDEKPDRLTCIMDKIIEEKLHNGFDLFKPDEAATYSLLAVHGSEHVKSIESLWSKNAEEREILALKADNIYYCQGSSRAAFLAAGGAIKEKKKIVILDFDIHHGNGTQEIFYEENRVLFISIHRYDTKTKYYPGTSDGGLDNIGNGPGRGFNVNCCLPYPCAGDMDYFAIWEDIVIPLIESYGPEIILISAGFDAAAGDRIGDCEVTPNGYATLVDMLMRLGPLVLVLEGGYTLDVLAECASACIKVLSGDKSGVIFEKTGRPLSSTLRMIKKTKEKLNEVCEILKEDQKKAAVAER